MSKKPVMHLLIADKCEQLKIESDRLDSIRLFQDSVHWEGKVFDVLIKNGCSKEDLVNVSSMLQTIYMCGFEVGKRCVKE